MPRAGDFVRIDYTGINEDGIVFDSTKGEISKRLRKKEGPVLVILGKNQIIRGLEEIIIGMKEGEEKEISVPPEKGFGNKKKDFFKVFKDTEFRKFNVASQPGLQVEVYFGKNRMVGTIKSVTSGRVLVDLNHPLAGQNLKYTLKVIKVLTLPDEKIGALLEETEMENSFKLNGESLEISLKKPKEMGKEEFSIRTLQLKNVIQSNISSIKKIDIKEGD